MLPITGCAVLVRMNPSGVVNNVFIIIGTSTAGLNSTAQVRVTSDPKGGMGLGMLLDSVTEVGTGTGLQNYDRNEAIIIVTSILYKAMEQRYK
jgi:hypothetical protein